MRYAWLVARFDGVAEGNVSEVLRVLELVKLINGNEYRRGLPPFGQHDAFVTMPCAGDEFIEMIPSLWQGESRGHTTNFTRQAAGGAGLTRAAGGQQQKRRSITSGWISRRKGDP